MTTAWKPGRRLFTTAALLMLLTAAAHTAGNLASGPVDDAERRLFEAMAGYRIPLGFGMFPSVADIYWDLVFTMTITFAALGVLNLVIAATPDAPHRLLRRVAWVNALWVGAFLVMAAIYRIPPPLISAVLIEVFVLAFLLTARKPA